MALPNGFDLIPGADFPKYGSAGNGPYYGIESARDVSTAGVNTVLTLTVVNFPSAGADIVTLQQTMSTGIEAFTFQFKFTGADPFNRQHVDISGLSTEEEA